MPTYETVTYRMDIVLSTQSGELPTEKEVEQLVTDQMSGVLDESTGLQCIAVGRVRILLT